jgi:hypothetical protein
MYIIMGCKLPAQSGCVTDIEKLPTHASTRSKVPKLQAKFRTWTRLERIAISLQTVTVR